MDWVQAQAQVVKVLGDSVRIQCPLGESLPYVTLVLVTSYRPPPATALMSFQDETSSPLAERPTRLPSPLPKSSPSPPMDESRHLLSESHLQSISHSNLALSLPTNPHPPSFQPLFTLIRSASTPSGPPAIHHPRIRYLFTVDPASEILTDALLTSLPPQSPTPSLCAPIRSNESLHTHHNVIVDLTHKGDAVESVCSLSSEWQVTGIELTRAPTWGGMVAEAAEEGGGLMLKIDGMGTAGWELETASTAGESRQEDLEGLVKKLEEGLEGLRNVVKLGGELNIADSRDEQHEQDDIA